MLRPVHPNSLGSNFHVRIEPVTTTDLLACFWVLNGAVTKRHQFFTNSSLSIPFPLVLWNNTEDGVSVPGAQGGNEVQTMSQLTSGDMATAIPKVDSQRMSKKLLIIEDEKPLCQVYSAALCQSHPYLEVVLAYNGEEGIKAALRERPHLVILDLALPGISGIEVALKLREAGILPEVPLIIVSGLGDEARVIAQSVGATAFLAKPFELGALVSAVEASGLEAVFEQPPVAGASSLS